MVMKPGPIFRAVEEIAGEPQEAEKILLSPQGEVFNQEIASELAAKKRLIFICGRYEGFDERIRQGISVREVSLGDFVLAGGEVAAMAIIEAVVRLIPGVLGDEESAKYESFSSQTGEARMLDYPQYTRPRVFRGMSVPQVLLSGDHEKIRKWREKEALKKTKTRRKDLLDKK
jgi:tRNA (guanine37-N1)-methyltransferase